MPAFRNWHARWSASGTSPVQVPTVRALRHCSSKRIAPVIPRSNFQNIAPMFRISHALLRQEDPRLMCPACPASPASLHAREDQLYAQLIARSNFKNATHVAQHHIVPQNHVAKQKALHLHRMADAKVDFNLQS